MLARKELLGSYQDWNRVHGAPRGRTIRGARFARRCMPDAWYLRLAGAFSVQPNSTTRAVEYPWAFHAAGLRPGMRVVEVGGGLSGFQFVLDQAGCKVVNVDPGMNAKGVGWPCDQASIRRLNRAFGTTVELRNCTVARAALEPESYDRAFSISVLEHLPEDEVGEVMRTVFQCLKPGGLFVLTVDLFINVAPFSSRPENEFGRNVDLRALCSKAAFEIAVGQPAELCGFAEFDPGRIQSRLEEYVVGQYPVLVQCLVLRKPDRPRVAAPIER